MSDRPVTLIEAVHARTGSFLRAAHVVAFIQAWAVVRRELGREPTIEEYRAHWKQPQRSAYRELERFREAFPEHESPSGVLDAGVPVDAPAGRRQPRPA